MNLLLIRHGQTTSNLARLLDTELPGAELTELGHAQAAELPAKLADEPLMAVVASPAHRARQTAAPLAAAHGLQVQVVPGLQEISAGDWEMSGERELVTAYADLVLAYSAGNVDGAAPGRRGESGRQVIQRLDAAIARAGRLLQDAGPHHSGAPGSVAVVAHGGVIRAWVGHRAQNLPHPLVDLWSPIPNTGVVRISGSPEAGWVCTEWVGQSLTDDDTD